MNYEQFLQYDYALINPLQVSIRHYETLNTLRLVPRLLQRHHHMMPLLVSLREQGSYEQMVLLDRSNEWQREYGYALFSLLIRSEASLTEVAACWRSRMLHWQPLLKRQVWLRLHDPRVIEPMQWILQSEQLEWLMRPATHWSWFNPLCQQWVTLVKPEVAQQIKAVKFEPSQWMKLGKLDSLNICLRDLTRKRGLGYLDKPYLSQEIMHDLLHATELGLTETEDIELYAQLRQLYGEQVHHTPILADCLQEAVQEGQSYSGLFYRNVHSQLEARLQR